MILHTVSPKDSMLVKLERMYRCSALKGTKQFQLPPGSVDSLQRDFHGPAAVCSPSAHFPMYPITILG